MNKCLLCSSIVTGFLMILIIYNRYNPTYRVLYVFVFLGILTSILNHGTKKKKNKVIDRTVIVLNVFVFLYFIRGERVKLVDKLSLLFLACFLYIYSKSQDSKFMRNGLHSSSHFLAVLLLWELVGERSLEN